MPTLKTKKIIIDPSNQAHKKFLFPQLESTNYLLTAVNVDTFPNALLTLPMVKIEKSKSNEPYFCVFNPEPLGSGNFGSVHQIVGMWKKTAEGWIFKQKSNPEKRRLLKTNAFNKYLDSVDLETYIQEQELGRHTPHMGMKYPPTMHDESKAFLLMRELPGTSLVHCSRYSTHRKLKLSINLLERFEQQICGIKLNNKGVPTYMVHRDIKPQNILEANDLPSFIDYGFAKYQNATSFFAGTDEYMAAELKYNPFTSLESKETDLYSLGITLQHLWSGDIPSSINQPLNDILKGMTNTKNKRISREQALEAFQLLLSCYEKESAPLNQIHATQTPLNDLTQAQLIAALESEYAAELIQRITQANAWDIINQKLPLFTLLDLHSSDLAKLKHLGFNYSSYSLTKDHLFLTSTCALKVKQAHQLGVLFSDTLLKDWMTQTIFSTDYASWAAVAAQLDAVAAIKPKQAAAVDFKSVYYYTVLKNHSKNIINPQAQMNLAKSVLTLFSNLSLSLHNKRTAAYTPLKVKLDAFQQKLSYLNCYTAYRYLERIQDQMNNTVVRELLACIPLNIAKKILFQVKTELVESKSSPNELQAALLTLAPIIRRYDPYPHAQELLFSTLICHKSKHSIPTFDRSCTQVSWLNKRNLLPLSLLKHIEECFIQYQHLFIQAQHEHHLRRLKGIIWQHCNAPLLEKVSVRIKNTQDKLTHWCEKLRNNASPVGDKTRFFGAMKHGTQEENRVARNQATL